MKKTKWLKKYMKIEHLKQTLNEGKLYLGDPQDWTDKNDRELIEIYKRKKKIADIRVTCLTMAPDRFHFWEIFGKKKSGVCLWFDEIELLSDIEKDNHLHWGKVSYYTPYQLETKCRVDDLPFVKRQQYRDEREFRVLREYNQVVGRKPQGITFSPKSLKRIYFNNWLCDLKYKQHREKIERKINKCYSHIDIKQNKILRFKKWIDVADRLE